MRASDSTTTHTYRLHCQGAIPPTPSLKTTSAPAALESTKVLENTGTITSGVCLLSPRLFTTIWVAPQHARHAPIGTATDDDDGGGGS
jgi:hypothetical protein